MALSLSKGANLSLTKTDPSLSRISVGLGWDPRATDGKEFDLDASAFLLTRAGKVRSDADFIFYNQLKSVEGSVEHTGDNRTGAGEGDDEVINVDLARVPADIEKVTFTVTIHDAEQRHQNFGQVGRAFIRVINEVTGVEVVRFDLAEDASTETAMIFAELYRYNGEWKFRAIGQGYSGGLRAVANGFGLNFG
ncbi:TerD family protein [Pseudomonas sp. KNUC1026]|uniref:TerD family protein n=1 Tax=Pseudomonas sp. KNUC1026 TaxID=2893890 RepID=UPI001F487384|nr:TerD family protein [Pseudomonas sp. KNUC1026]UFH50804.1 TerD family protein [Pseudomonas sp. KNUC1026]